MNKPISFVFTFVLLLELSFLRANAQTSASEIQTDIIARKAIKFLNAGLPDSVYQLAGSQFKKQINPDLWNSIYKSQFSAFLPFKEVDFINSVDSVNKYKLVGQVTLTYYVSLDKEGKLKDFLFKPYQEEIKPGGMDVTEKKTDTLARKILNFINHKQTDSIYAYAGESFKNKIDAKTWKSIAENGLFPLTPLGEPVFINSKNGVNKYKLNQYQYIFSLDKAGKFRALALQPYLEETLKTEKVLSDNPLKTQLDSVVNKVLSAYIQTKGNVGLSAAVYFKGKSYFYNYGEARQGNAQLPTDHTLYDIGSITKTFTATLLAIAINQGKVTLQTPIPKFLPDSVSSNPALKAITFKELANHTSGLPGLPDSFQSTVKDIYQPYVNYKIQDVFSFLKHFKAVRAPGTKYEYSNFAAGLLGVLLERIYHKPYRQLVEQYITGPEKLNETMFTVANANLNRLAQGYDEQGRPVPVWNFDALQACGVLKSTAFDLLIYGKLQLNTSNQTLRPALLLTHQVTFNDTAHIVGLGWHYLTDDKNVLQHAGGTGGYRSMICADPKRQIVVVVLTNNASTGDATGIQLTEALEAVGK
jgi:CubicO group peptidase (beta-lactamase class C family)